MSGYFSYRNYFGTGCSRGPLSSLVTCGGPQALKIFHQPACVYGFSMFMLVFIVGIVAVIKRPTGPLMGVSIVPGIAGTAFPGYLSFYELAVQHLPLKPMPARIYGLVFYFGSLFSSIIGRQSLLRQLNTLPPLTTEWVLEPPPRLL